MNLKHFSLLLLAGITYITTFAQPRIKDQGVIGGDNNDFLTSMYLTKDGGLVVGGYSNSPNSDQKTENSRGYNDYWIVKLDSNRTIRWNKTIGGSNDDYLRAIRQTADGGYIAGGYSYSDSSGEKTENSRGSIDYWVVKLGAEGTIQWDRTIGGSDYDDLQDLQQTADGGYILGGSSSSAKSGDKTEDNKGYGTDYWIVKLDAAGSIQWQKVIGGSERDEFGALQQTGDGGYIVGGQSFSNKSGDKTENSKGYYDYWIVKLDAAGNMQWDKTIGGSKPDVFRALQQTGDGGYILGGYSYSDKSGDKTEHTKGETDYWIIKLNSLGNIQWDKTISGNSYDYLYALQQTTDGGYVVSGESFSSIFFDKTEVSRGGYDYWIVKLNSNGKIQWDKTIGGSSTELAPVILEIKKNDYAVGGSSYSRISGDKTGGTRGNYDYWLVELRYLKPDSTAVTQILKTGKLKASLNNTLLAYPNPAHNKLTILSTGKATFTLTNQQGKVLFIKVIENAGTMDLTIVPSGVYYLTNTTTGATQKVVVNK